MPGNKIDAGQESLGVEKNAIFSLNYLKIHIFRTVSPFWPPFEAIGSYLDVFSYKNGLVVIRWLFYVVVLETYRCVDFYHRERVRLLCYRTVCFCYIT